METSNKMKRIVCEISGSLLNKFTKTKVYMESVGGCHFSLRYNIHEKTKIMITYMIIFDLELSNHSNY